jgi:phenylacetate-CoA ligase
MKRDMGARDDPASAAWPHFISAKSSVRNILDGFRETERLDSDSLQLGQSLQLRRLLRWIAGQSRYYQNAGWTDEVLRDLDQRPDAFWDVWRRIPVLTKPDLRAHGDLIHSVSVPDDQKPLGLSFTSGSTGIAVEVRTTAVTRVMGNALTVRENVWQRRDFLKRLGAIRYRPAGDRDPAGSDLPSWGPPSAALFRTGPASYIHVGHSVNGLAAWLARFDPHYLITFPSVAEPLLARVAELTSRPLRLEEIRFIAEPLDPELERRLVERHRFHVSDIYSANEVGIIAFRCELGSLHVQSESVLVEIIDNQWRACGPGEAGHLVVTALHNLATPLIRYDLGDFAIPGDPCACGRGLPVIRQVLGRVRNLVRTPDGRRSWPVDLAKIRSVRVIRQAQFFQTSIDTVQLNIVSERPLTMDEQGQATEAVRAALGYPFNVAFVRVDDIPRGPTGKFEEFMSQLDEPSLPRSPSP